MKSILYKQILKMFHKKKCFFKFLNIIAYKTTSFYKPRSSSIEPLNLYCETLSLSVAFDVKAKHPSVRVRVLALL